MENMDAIDSKGEGVSVPSGNGADSHLVKPPTALLPKEVREQGLLGTSDAEGLGQLLFHLCCLGLCAMAVSWCYKRSYWALLVLAEVPFGIVESFLFNGFHEMVHNTAFRTPALNSALAQVLGFLNFRGAKWFWCFHWAHHRYTNDPTKDPELSGGSLDLDDPTRTAAGYIAFLSGYPFGFERVVRMWRLALGTTSADPWVADKPPATQSFVRKEAAAYVVGYICIAAVALLRPVRVGVPVILYWLLPHCLGAGHLRLYQFAEHRACAMGSYTDTNAWACARTTSTWWLYRKLAWQMPYHIEHHAYPNVPFHKLEDLHTMVKAAYAKEGHEHIPSGCDPSGEKGYVSLHTEIFNRMVANVTSAKAANKDKAA